MQPRFPVPQGGMVPQGPQLRPRPMVRPGPAPAMGQNMQPRHVQGLVPQQVGLQRAPSRGTPFRPTGNAGGGISLGAIFGEGALGQQNRPAGSYRCLGRPDPTTGQPRPCVEAAPGGMGEPLTMGIDDYFTNGNVGPMCEKCWADSWVTHPMQNRPSMPPCRFGVQWTETEWGNMQKAIQDTIQNFMSPIDPETKQQRIDAYGRPYVPRMPSADDINRVLQSFKWSRNCPRCEKLLGSKTPVAFTPDANDFRIAGINA